MFHVKHSRFHCFWVACQVHAAFRSPRSPFSPGICRVLSVALVFLARRTPRSVRRTPLLLVRFFAAHRPTCAVRHIRFVPWEPSLPMSIRAIVLPHLLGVFSETRFVKHAPLSPGTPPSLCAPPRACLAAPRAPFSPGARCPMREPFSLGVRRCLLRVPHCMISGVIDAPYGIRNLHKLSYLNLR